MVLTPQSPPRHSVARRRRIASLILALLAVVAGAAGLVVAHRSHAAKFGPTIAIRVRNAAAARGLDVLPFPGTPDASPQTRLIFPALGRSQIRSVAVTGAASGTHEGRLIGLPGRRGTAFVPRSGFAPGEKVAVIAHLRSDAAGALSGAGRSTTLVFGFTVASPVQSAHPATALGGLTSPSTAPPSGQSPGPFRSAPDLDPPTVSVTKDPDRDSGDVFLDVQNAPQTGPMILDSKGRLVWFKPDPNSHISAMDVRAQRYRQQPVLTYWEGRLVPPFYFGEGVGMVLNHRYQPIHVVHAGDGYEQDGLDEHEFTLTHRGTAFVTIQAPVRANLSKLDGPQNGVLLDSIVQEIDVATNRVVWEWHSFGHVPLIDSYAGKPVAGLPYDFFHINSIQRLSDGSLLISARNTWAVYDVSPRTGKIIWSLGGKDPSFKMGPGTSFEWQHDARVHPHSTLTVFDDGASPAEEKQSRALYLHLDPRTMTATLLHAYEQRPSLLSESQGSMQILPNGNVFVGWGSGPAFSEYRPNGKRVWDGTFAPRFQSYRAYRAPWHGEPTTRPAIVVTAGSNGSLTVYASWNGATGVARWQVIGGSSKSDLAPIGSQTKTGFETVLHVHTGAPYVAVRALSGAGTVLATSPAVAR